MSSLIHLLLPLLLLSQSLGRKRERTYMRLNDHPTHNHLTQGRVQRLKVKDQIQLAHVLKQPIQRFHIHLDQIYQRQRTLRARANNDKV